MGVVSGAQVPARRNRELSVLSIQPERGGQTMMYELATGALCVYYNYHEQTPLRLNTLAGLLRLLPQHSYSVPDSVRARLVPDPVPQDPVSLSGLDAMPQTAPVPVVQYSVPGCSLLGLSVVLPVPLAESVLLAVLPRCAGPVLPLPVISVLPGAVLPAIAGPLLPVSVLPGAGPVLPVLPMLPLLSVLPGAGPVLSVLSVLPVSAWVGRRARRECYE